MKKHELNLNHPQIARLLTRGTEQLDDEIVAALCHARTVALNKQRVHEPVFSLSTIGHRAHELLPHSAPQWVVAAVLLAAIAIGVGGYWQQTQDHHNLDIAILTDDMPIEVFLDQ